MAERPLFARIDTIILRVRDYEAAADWYVEKLGLEATHIAAALHVELQGRGVAVESLQEGGGVRFFSFWDLDGNRLEACQVLGGAEW